MYPYALSTVGSLVLVVLGIGVWLVGNGWVDVGVPLMSSVPWGLVGGITVFLGVLGVAVEAVRWWSRQYVVTTEEVYEKRGLVSRTVTNLPHDQVQNTSFSQSIPGRLLSYGDVRIDTAGGGGAEIVFENAEDPDAVVEEVTRHLDG